jgi:amidohydrolase
MPDDTYIDELELQVRRILPECIALRRKIHAHPELSLQEKDTAAAISAFLREHGLNPQSYDFPSVVCDSGETAGIALRADMDALPIVEDSGEEFSSSVEGVMHACGHDAHSSILAGAAAVIHNRKRTGARFIFQPAEEIGKGAKMMIEAGALDGMERIFGLHVWPSLETGTVAILDGPAMAAPDVFSIAVRGAGGHGAYPHLASDTILASSSIIGSANWIVSRTLDPLQSGVISFGEIKGGNAPNVIPSDVVMRGTMRSFSKEVRKRLVEGMERACSAAETNFGVKTEFRLLNSGPAVINDAEFAAKCRSLAGRFMGNAACNPTMGSEDFAYYLEKVKGAFAFLGTGGDDGTRASKHSARFRFDEKAMFYGIMLEVIVAEKWNGPEQ